jgi:hypothetical protein
MKKIECKTIFDVMYYLIHKEDSLISNLVSLELTLNFAEAENLLTKSQKVLLKNTYLTKMSYLKGIVSSADIERIYINQKTIANGLTWYEGMSDEDMVHNHLMSMNAHCLAPGKDANAFVHVDICEIVSILHGDDSLELKEWKERGARLTSYFEWLTQSMGINKLPKKNLERQASEPLQNILNQECPSFKEFLERMEGN